MKSRTLTLALWIVAAAAAQSTTPAAKQTPPAKPAAAPMTIPPGAVHESNGSYTWTDKAGKKWTYRSGIFGVTRTPWRDPAAAGTTNAAQPMLQNVKVTDEGDSVRFERQEPLGKVVWEKKKTDLNADEKKIYDQQKDQAK